MAYTTIIVAFDNAARASAAVRALRDLGVPAGDIKRHPVEAGSAAEVAAVSVMEPSTKGFWAWLFDRDAEEHQIALYQQALQKGGTILSIRVLDDEAGHVSNVIQSFGPLDLKETAAKL